MGRPKKHHFTDEFLIALVHDRATLRLAEAEAEMAEVRKQIAAGTYIGSKFRRNDRQCQLEDLIEQFTEGWVKYSPGDLIERETTESELTILRRRYRSLAKAGLVVIENRRWIRCTDEGRELLATAAAVEGEA